MPQLTRTQKTLAKFNAWKSQRAEKEYIEKRSNPYTGERYFTRGTTPVEQPQPQQGAVAPSGVRYDQSGANLLTLDRAPRTTTSTPETAYGPVTEREESIAAPRKRTVANTIADSIRGGVNTWANRIKEKEANKDLEQQSMERWRELVMAKQRGISPDEAARIVRDEKSAEFNKKLAVIGAGAAAVGVATGSGAVLPLIKTAIKGAIGKEALGLVIKTLTGGEKDELSDFGYGKVSDNDWYKLRLLEDALVFYGSDKLVSKAVDPIMASIAKKLPKEAKTSLVAAIRKVSTDKTQQSLDTLGLPNGASKQQIRDKYNSIAKRLHPDTNKTGTKGAYYDEAAARKEFTAATDAYKYLIKNYNPDKVKTGPGATKENVEHIKNLKELGLQWGESRRGVANRYEELKKRGGITPAQEDAYNKLMRGETPYNPYGETPARVSDTRTTSEIIAGATKNKPVVRGLDAINNAINKVSPDKPIPMPERMGRFGGLLTEGIGKVEVPAANTPAAEFQILDPKKAAKLNAVKKKLEAIRDSKQALIDSGRSGQDKKEGVEIYNKAISNIESKINELMAEQSIKTGPISTRDRNAPVAGRQVYPSQDPPAKTVSQPSSPQKNVKTAVIKKMDADGQKALREIIENKKRSRIEENKKKREALANKEIAANKEAKLTAETETKTREMVNDSKEKPLPTRQKTITKTEQTNKPARKEKSYKEISESVRDRSTSTKKESSAVTRLLGGRKREDIAKAARAKQAPKESSIPEYKKTPLRKELEKMHRNGADIADFSALAEEKMSKFLAGESKVDESDEVNEFIYDMFTSKAERYYASKTSKNSTPEERAVKPPKKRKFLGLFGAKEDFKLYKEMQAVIKKYVSKLSERDVPRNALGVYRQRTDSVSIKSRNNIAVATHEVAHAVDVGNNITQRIANTNNRKVINALYGIYARYYSNKKTPPQEEALAEGFATLVERYVVAPKQTEREFPILVNEIIKPGGMYYNSTLSAAIKDLDDVVSRYMALDEWEREMSKMAIGASEINTKKITASWESFMTEFADYVYPMENMEVSTPIEFTGKAPSIWFRARKMGASLAMHNIKGGRGYFTIDQNGFVNKKFDYNFGSVAMDLVESGDYIRYSQYLRLRRYHEMKLEADKLLKGNKAEVEEGERIMSIIENAGIDTDMAARQVKLHEGDFVKTDAKFDSMTQESLETMNNFGLITDEYYEKLGSKKGYAKIEKQIYDEMNDDGYAVTSGPKRSFSVPNQMKEMRGSDLVDKDPYMATALSQMYVNEKAAMQQVLVNLYRNKNPKHVEEISVTKIKDKMRVFFPKRNRDIFSFRLGDEEIKIRLSAKLTEVFNVEEDMRGRDIVLSGLKKFSSFYIKGTTGILYPAFGIGKNIILDMFTASAQTRERTILGVSGAKAAVMSIAGRKEIANPLSSLLGKLFGEKEVAENLQFYRDAWDSYMAAGGDNLTYYGQNSSDPTEVSADILKLGSKPKRFLKKGIYYAGKTWGFLPTRGEAFNRFPEYVAALKSGKPHIVAFEEAARVSGAFSHRGRGLGRFGRSIQELSVYLNARKQLTIQTILAAKDRKTRWRALSTMSLLAAAKIAGLITIVSKYKEAQESGTEEDKANSEKLLNDYLNTSQYNLENHILSLDWDNKHINKAAVPGNYLLPGTILTGMMAEAMVGKDYNALDAAKTVKDVLVPEQFDLTDPIGAATSWIPTIVKPLADVGYGSTAFPKFKRIESDFMKNKPSETRYYPWTNDLAIMLGQTEMAKKMDLSPLEIEVLMRGYGTRSLTDYTEFISEPGVSKLLGFGKTFGGQTTLNTYPFAGEMFDKFYKIRDKAESEYDNAKNKEVKDRDDIRDKKEKTQLFTEVNQIMWDLRSLANSGKEPIDPATSNKMYKIVKDITDGKIDEVMEDRSDIKLLYEYLKKRSKEEGVD